MYMYVWEGGSVRERESYTCEESIYVYMWAWGVLIHVITDYVITDYFQTSTMHMYGSTHCNDVHVCTCIYIH